MCHRWLHPYVFATHCQALMWPLLCWRRQSPQRTIGPLPCVSGTDVSRGVPQGYLSPERIGAYHRQHRSNSFLGWSDRRSDPPRTQQCGLTPEPVDVRRNDASYPIGDPTWSIETSGVGGDQRVWVLWQLAVESEIVTRTWTVLSIVSGTLLR